MDAIVIKDLRKTFRLGKSRVEALRGVDLEVKKGEIFGFLGPNGAGKTTTVRILATLMPADRGEALVAGIDVAKHPEEVRRKIGYVGQKGGSDSKATGWENLILQGRLYGMSRSDAKSSAENLVTTFSLEECIGRFVSTYSGGQQRRLDIALGMMHHPEILFLDEPTTGLDPQNRANLWSKILKLKENGVTIFLTSHYLEEVDALADHLAIMDHGKIVATGSPIELKQQISGDIVTIGVHKDRHQDVISVFNKEENFIREIISGDEHMRLYVEKGGSALPQILRLLDHAKIDLETIQLSMPSLDDVFLKKTGRLLREESKR
ncbi:MAG: ATP-binding cassette domain-containing protein [Simkaniaceae bacterium]|nr:ATP-binding cassette domain-containing protein [Simkaniaceae bacterium]